MVVAPPCFTFATLPADTAAAAAALGGGKWEDAHTRPTSGIAVWHGQLNHSTHRRLA
jgi:hypothetical protein